MFWKKLPVATVGLVLGLVQVAAAQDSPVLKRIQEKGVIDLGYREGAVPFSYIGPDGTPRGFSIDLCMKIVDKIKETLKRPDLKLNMVPVTSANRIPLMANGTIDLECGTTAVTLSRLQQVNFLPVMFVTGVKLMVKKSSGIKEIEDLKGKSIGVTLGTTEEKLIRDLSESGKLNINVVPVKEHTQGGLALATDRIDAYTTDDVLLYGLISKSKNPDDYAVVGRNLYPNYYAIMAPFGDDVYLNVGRSVLATLMRTGDIYKLYDKWFVGKGTVNMELNDANKWNYTLQGLYP
jgi:glutamate/aspartate transport system substrate-binding protein